MGEGTSPLGESLMRSRPVHGAVPRAPEATRVLVEEATPS
jgi:hypothetical protein